MQRLPMAERCPRATCLMLQQQAQALGANLVESRVLQSVNVIVIRCRESKGAEARAEVVAFLGVCDFQHFKVA